MHSCTDSDDGSERPISEESGTRSFHMADMDEALGDTAYTVPQWFLKRNVRLYEKNRGDAMDIAIIDTGGEGDTKEKGSTKLEVHRDDYEFIRLTACSALINTKKGNLPSNTPTITIRMRNDKALGSLAYIDHLVARVACDAKADLISISAEDLEDLGWEFHQQDRHRGQGMNESSVKVQDAAESRPSSTRSTSVMQVPNDDSPYGSAEFYFSQSGGDESDGTAKRIDAFIRAILNSVRQESANTTEEGIGHTQGPAPHKLPVILHLTGTNMLDSSSAKRVLQRFAEYINKVRMTTKEPPFKVLGVASGLDYWSGYFHFLAKDDNQFELPPPPNYSSHTAFYKIQDTRYSQARNIKRFKQLLRKRLSHRFDPHVLDMHDAESSEIHQQRWLEVFPGSAICEHEQLERAATQITGNLCEKDKLSMDDIVDVCLRLSRKGLWSCKASSDEDDSGEESADEDQESTNESADEDQESTKESADDDQQSTKERDNDDQQSLEESANDNQQSTERLSWSERKAKIAFQCNKHENQLLECVVDPATLTTTYDDVIIDERVKEEVKELMNLSKIKPQAESRALLEQIRLTGALFYGPPGTGKTLLCKAIASDGRYNMLVLSPAVVNSDYVGEAEKIIAAAFSLSTKLSPCLLFIDEADALFFRRTSKDKRWERSELNQFLQEMDGLTKVTNDSPFVIIGTNRPSELDDAFLRRLPYKISFPLPDAANRAKILHVFLHPGDMDPRVNLASLANQMTGFSGSDIRSFCGHAALAWAVEKSRNSQTRDCKIHLQQHHFEAALKRTRPTVSAQSTMELREFEKKFNPGDNNILSALVDGFGSEKATSIPSIVSQVPHSEPSLPEEQSAIGISSMAPQDHHSGTRLSAEQPILGLSLSKADLDLLETCGYSNFIRGDINYTFLKNQAPGRSLGRLAEDCFGKVDPDFISAFHATSSDPPSFDLVKEMDAATVRAFTNWYRLQFLFFSGHADKAISWEQRYSYQMLFDWWLGAYQDPSIPWNILRDMTSRSKCLQSIIKAVDERGYSDFREADGELKLLAYFVQSYNEALHAHSIKRFSATQSKKPSRHTQAFIDLFQAEFFHPDAYRSEAKYHHSSLQSTRREVACQTYCHQAAMQCLGQTRNNTLRGDASMDSLGSWICSVEASDASYPRTLSHGPLIRSCPWLDLKTSTSPRNATRVDDGDGGDDGDDGDDALDGWPEYLWDIEKRRTVSTRGFQTKLPTYIAISHTWGRWQKNSRVQIPGALEPPIPENSKFRVEKIPDMLYELNHRSPSIKTKYVWLDLLCIPQVPPKDQWETTDEKRYSEWEYVQDKEIARQASIFRNAQSAIAWLHDVDDLSCLSALSEVFSIHCAETGPGLPKSDLKNRLDHITADAVSRTRGQTTGFVSDEPGLVRYAESPFELQSASGKSKQREPTGWFTSLWTLQEVCLRPDMWLATSGWDMLSYSNGEPVPLNGFLCLYNEWQSGGAEHPELEAPMKEITEWTEATGLSNILDLSRVDILQLGDRRQCGEKHRRAEAIMSALGTTRWFKKNTNRAAEELILGKYPVDFINEIRQSIAGPFFSTFAKFPHADPRDQRQVIGGAFSSLYGRPIVDFYEQTAMASSGLWDLKGSLLPFSGMGHHYFRHPLHLVNELKLDTHHSISTWKVLTSGRVTIPGACILSSRIEDDNVPKSELRYVFWGFLGREDGKRASILQGSDIHKWTKERRSEIHLVVVMSGVMHETQSTGGRPATGPDLEHSGSNAGEKEGYVRSIMHVAQGIVLRSTKADSQKAAERKGRVRDLEGKPQRLVKIGNFLCYTDGRIILPETRRVDWEIL